MTHPFTIVYLTNRGEPKFDWFADGLSRQADGDFPEVVIVDALQEAQGRKEKLQAAVRGRFGYKHVLPKPNPWNGKHKLCRTESFAASSTRNTGVCHATHAYVVFVDDLSIFMPGWMVNVRDAVVNNDIVCGAYKKVKNLVVEDGHAKSWDEFPQGLDCRLGMGRDSGKIPCSGGHLYGCSFGIPVRDYLSINGMDEICDGMGYEDVRFGEMLEKTGRKLFYNRNMMTFESEELHAQGPRLLRQDKKLWGEQGAPQMVDAGEILAKMLAENPYGQGVHSKDLHWLRGRRIGGPDMSHIIMHLNRMRSGSMAIGNQYDLGAMRNHILAGGEFPILSVPIRHWPDSQLLAEI